MRLILSTVLQLLVYCLFAAPILAQTSPKSDSATTRESATLHPSIRGAHVTVIHLNSEVDLGMLSYVEHALKRAESQHEIVVLEINTFGGRVDVATKIRDAVLGSTAPLTVAFINPRAISAGTLISLAAQKIVMAPGGTMGAATPIYASGEKASPKVVSYMVAEMRSTAERRHRNPDVAAAMVDENLGLDSTHTITVPKGRLLALTTNDAIKLGYADTTALTVSEALAALGYPNAQITDTRESIFDAGVRFFTGTLISGLLIMIGLVGVFYTIKTGHFGAITMAAILSLILFFGAEYLSSIPPVLALLVFLAGILLLLIEISPVPSFGVAGVFGIIGLGLGLYLALAGDLNTMTPERSAEVYTSLSIALVGFFLAAALIIKYAPKSAWMNRFTNRSHSADMTEYHEARTTLIGRQGTTATPLRPAGLAFFDGVKFDVVTRGEFLPVGATVAIVEVKGNRNVVELAAPEPVQTLPEEPHEPFGGRLPGNLQPRV